MFTEAGCAAVLRCCEQTNRGVERNVLCVCTHTYHSSSSSYTYSYSSSSSSATASSFFDGSDQKLPSSSFNACATAPPTTNARSAVRNRRAGKTAADVPRAHVNARGEMRRACGATTYCGSQVAPLPPPIQCQATAPTPAFAWLFEPLLQHVQAALR